MMMTIQMDAQSQQTSELPDIGTTMLLAVILVNSAYLITWVNGDIAIG